MEEKQEHEQKETDFKIKGEIEIPKLDITPYIGKKKKIEYIRKLETKFGYAIKVETEVLALHNNSEGKEKEIRAGEMFGLQKDKQGNIGFGKDTKLGRFLRKYGLTHPDELIGQEVITQSKTAKDGNDYLTFN